MFSCCSPSGQSTKFKFRFHSFVHASSSRELLSVRVRWDSDPRHFNPVKYADWLRARRSTWLSYEPTKSLRTKAVFKLNEIQFPILFNRCFHPLSLLSDRLRAVHESTAVDKNVLIVARILSFCQKSGGPMTSFGYSFAYSLYFKEVEHLLYDREITIVFRLLCYIHNLISFILGYPLGSTWVPLAAVSVSGPNV